MYLGRDSGIRMKSRASGSVKSDEPEYRDYKQPRTPSGNSWDEAGRFGEVLFKSSRKSLERLGT